MEGGYKELEILIQRCEMRDERALEELYEKVAAFLNGVAYRILHNEALSNEVIQDSFIKIWQNADKYNADLGKPLTWMCRIVRNRAIDIVRTERKYLSGDDVENELVEIEHLIGGLEPEDECSKSQSRAVIYSCMEALEPNEQRCIQLAYIKGYSRNEIAEVLGAKVNTVKSWLHRGSAKLKRRLEAKMDIV